MGDDKFSNELEQTFDDLSAKIIVLFEQARRQAARSVNAILTAAYWKIGRYINEYEQEGAERAKYGDRLIERLSQTLTQRFGRGFSRSNLQQMRQFYSVWQIRQTLSGESADNNGTGTLYDLETLGRQFPLAWSHYVRLMALSDEYARRFYEKEALRGGWSLRQLNRQIDSMYYERTALSRDKSAMLIKQEQQTEITTVEEELKSPYILEFLGLKDEYSEAQLEEALIQHLESFLLELGNDFTFAARQKRIRVGDVWYRIDLLFYHRTLRCLIIIDLKVGRFEPADVGQMNLYVNYAAEHLTHSDENPPVGLILCSEPDNAAAHYALNNLVNTILFAQYKTLLPDPVELEQELEKTRHLLDARNKEILGNKSETETVTVGEIVAELRDE